MNRKNLIIKENGEYVTYINLILFEIEGHR